MGTGESPQLASIPSLVGQNSDFLSKAGWSHLYTCAWFSGRWFNAKVLLDRIREIFVLTRTVTHEQWHHKYAPGPRIPSVGNAFRTLALCLIPSLWTSARLPRWIATTIPALNAKTTPVLEKEAKQLDLAVPKPLWPHRETVLCCYGKIIDRMFDLPRHAAYWTIASRSWKYIF